MDVLGPRLFGIKASECDVIAVLRRGPSDWCHVSRWDVTGATLEPGAWFRGTIAPQKCDLSPDGKWFLYSAVKYPGTWDAGAVYEAISRLPWLHALVAWEAGTTYTRGAHFVSDPRRCELGEPSTGELGRIGIGLALTRPEQFAVERRSGWVETTDTEARDAADTWDQRRTVSMTKTQPQGEATLTVSGQYAAFRSNPHWYEGTRYALHLSGDEVVLEAVQWAEWSSGGELLTADHHGVLRAYRLAESELHETQSYDLSGLSPDPQPPPEAARHW